MSPPQTRLLPVNMTFYRAYQLTWLHRRPLLRAAIIPFVLLTVALTLYYQIFSSIQPRDHSVTDVLARIPPLRILTTWLTGFLGMLTLVSLNVTWRRFLLGLATTVDSTWFHKPFWKYGLSIFIGTLVFVCLFSIFGSVLGTLLAKLVGPKSPALAIPFLMVVVALLAALAWHVPLFTEMLTDEPKLDIPRYRAAMNGNVWRLLGIWLLTFATLISGEHILTLPLGFVHDPGAVNGLAVLQCAMLAVLMIMVAVIGSAISALVYDFAVRGTGPKR